LAAFYPEVSINLEPKTVSILLTAYNVLGTDRDYDNPLWTVNWKATVTPSGNATLSCHYKKKWEFQCEDYGNCVEP
jgi:hypothetical protein